MFRKISISLATDKQIDVIQVNGKDGLKTFFDNMQQTNEARKRNQFGMFSPTNEKAFVLYENGEHRSLLIINPIENHIEHYDIINGRGLTEDMKEVLNAAIPITMPNAHVNDVSLAQRKQNIYDPTANQNLPKQETNENQQQFLQRAIVNGIQQIEQALELEKRGALSMISIR